MEKIGREQREVNREIGREGRWMERKGREQREVNGENRD